MSIYTALEDNAYDDVKDWIASLDRPVNYADFVDMSKAGLSLTDAAVRFTKEYDGKKPFMANMQTRLRFRGLTQPMMVTVLNIWREQMLDSPLTAPEEPDHRPTEPVKLDCGLCGALFDTFDELDGHKADVHGDTVLRKAAVADQGEAVEILQNQESKKGLDLSGLPDGRYAAPDPSGKNDYIFLMVKRRRRTVERKSDYRYSKFVKGNELVLAGTIEVQEWKSDCREWVGQQKPGDVYRGEFEDQLELIMMAPEPLALLFGKLLGYCSRCGKRLTDDVSRQIGLGLDCEKYLAEGYYKKAPKYTFIGTDRPDKEKADPKDARYLPESLKHLAAVKP